MNLLTEHLAEIVTLAVALISAIYTTLRVMNNMRDQLYDHKIGTLKDDIAVIEHAIIDINKFIHSNEDVKKINDAISALIQNLSEVKSVSLRKDDIDRVHMRIDDIAKILQTTREEIMRESATDVVDGIAIQDTFKRLQSAVTKCTDCRTCDYLDNGGVERRKHPPRG
jgi:hypothetical protein